MAIKGKGKARSRRVIAAPPRPQLMIRKRPFLARRSTWVALGAIAVAAVALAVFLGIRSNRAEAREGRERIAVQEFANLVQRQLPAGGEQLGASQYLLYPKLIEDLTRLSAGDLKAKTAKTRGQDLARGAGRARDGVNAIIVREVIPEEFPETKSDLTLAQFLMAEGFGAYQRVGRLMATAADAEGAQRTAIVEEATLLATQGGNLFDRGWSILAGIRSRLGIAQPFNPFPEQVPPVPQPTGAIPSGPQPSPTTT
jgi:hypothetical protein